MKNRLRALLLLYFLLAGCAPATQQVTPRLLTIHVASAAYPRVDEIYKCAPASVVISLADPSAAQLTLRLGEPAPLVTPAYQVGTEDLLIVTHPQAGTGPLSLEQVRQLFSGTATNWEDVGGIDLAVQVWTYAAGEDIQQAFDRAVMDGQPVTSMAQLAEMSTEGFEDFYFKTCTLNYDRMSEAMEHADLPFAEVVREIGGTRGKGRVP